MPDGLNKVMLIGRLITDPEMRYTGSGTANTNFRLAVTRTFDGEQGTRRATERFRVVVWGRLAEELAQGVQRGQLVHVEGRLASRSWDGPDGQKRYATEVIGNQVLRLGAAQDVPDFEAGEAADGAELEETAADELDGYNRTMIIGNLGADPEMRYTANGNALTTFRVAVSRRRNTAEGRQEETEWFRIATWSKLAEFAGQYLQKGRKVYVEGRLSTRSWDGPDGQKHYMTELVGDQLIPLDRQQGAQFPDAVGDSGDVDPDELPFQ